MLDECDVVADVKFKIFHFFSLLGKSRVTFWLCFFPMNKNYFGFVKKKYFEIPGSETTRLQIFRTGRIIESIGKCAVCAIRIGHTFRINVVVVFMGVTHFFAPSLSPYNLCTELELYSP